MNKKLISLLVAICLIIGLLPAFSIAAEAEVTTATVTLWGTEVTVDTDDTTEDIPAARYWVNATYANKASYVDPAPAESTDDWNYSFTIVDGVPTVTLRNAVFKTHKDSGVYDKHFLVAAYDGELELRYEGTNTFTFARSAARSIVKFTPVTATLGISTLKITGAEGATLTANTKGNGYLFHVTNRAKMIFSGGTLNYERTAQNCGLIYGPYCPLEIKDCKIDCNTTAGGGYAVIAAGFDAHGITINNAEIDIVTAGKGGGIVGGVTTTSSTVINYAADITIKGDSKVTVDVQGASTTTYQGKGIYGRNLAIQGGTVEVKGATAAIGNGVTPNLENYNGNYAMYTTEGGEAVTEYTSTTYFKVEHREAAPTQTTTGTTPTETTTGTTPTETTTGTTPTETTTGTIPTETTTGTTPTETTTGTTPTETTTGTTPTETTPTETTPPDPETSKTVTLWGTEYTIDASDSTPTPAARYWINASYADPTPVEATENWNYSFTVVDGVPTVTLRNAVFKTKSGYDKSFLLAKYDGALELRYEGTNTFEFTRTASRYIVNFEPITAQLGISTLKITGAEGATLTAKTGGNGYVFRAKNRAQMIFSGGALNYERTGQPSGFIYGPYCPLLIENCKINCNSATGSYAVIAAGFSDHGITINNAEIDIVTAGKGGAIVGGVTTTSSTVINYVADIVIKGNSKVTVDVQGASTTTYQGKGIYGRNLAIQGGAVEVSGATAAVKLTTEGAVPALSAYDGYYKMYTAKGTVTTNVYTETTYFKIEPTDEAPCQHKGGEATCKELAVCTECGEVYGLLADHAGGTATCIKLAVCEVCNEPYGELTDHTYDNELDTDCNVCNEVRVPLSDPATRKDVTLWGTKFTIDANDITLAPAALYWTNNETKDAVPTLLEDAAKIAAGEWNYSFTLVDGVPTLTLKNAYYYNTKKNFLRADVVQGGRFDLKYEGENTYKNNAAGYFVFATVRPVVDKGSFEFNLIGVGNAVLNITCDAKAPAITTAPQAGSGTSARNAIVNIKGGTVNYNRTQSSYGFLSTARGSVLIEDAVVNCTSTTEGTAYFPVITAGSSDMAGTNITIKNSKVDIKTRGCGIGAGVLYSGGGLNYGAPLNIEGNSEVNIETYETDESKISVASGAQNYIGYGIYASRLNVKDTSKVEIKGAIAAAHLTATDAAPDMSAYQGYYKMYLTPNYTANEYVETTYLKIEPSDVPPCVHEGGEISCEKLPVCSKCGEKYGALAPHTGGEATCIKLAVCSVCNKEYGKLAAHTGGEATCEEPAVCSVCGEEYGKPAGHSGSPATCIALAKCDKCGKEYGELTDCTPNFDEGEITDLISCSVCGKVLATRGPGLDLIEAITVNVGGVEMTISKFDEPVYVVNTPVEMKDTEGNSFQGMMPTITTNESNWNAMLVWKSKANGPTLYIDGLIIDDFNEEKSLWKRSPSSSAAASTYGIDIPDGRYVRVVITGEDSSFKTKYGIRYKSKLSIESEGNAKLTSWNQNGAVFGSPGKPLVVNANLDLFVRSYANADYSHVLMTRNADLTINGGTIKIDSGAENGITAIYAKDSGNVIINDGKIAARGTWKTSYKNGTIQSTAGKIIINGGTVDAEAKYASAMYALEGIEINGGIVNLTSPNWGLGGGTTAVTATFTFNGGTTTIVAKNACFKSYSVVVVGPNMYAYAGAGPRSAQIFDGTNQKLKTKPWMLITDDESKKIVIEEEDEEIEDILVPTEATTGATAPTVDPSVDPNATDATNPDEYIPEDDFYEDDEDLYDDNYYGVTPNLDIVEGIDEEIPDALLEMGIESADMIRDILVEMVWAVDDYSDYFAFFDIKLMYHDGEDWVVADEEHYPEEGYITVMLPYPEGTDMDTPFTAVHMFTSDAFGMTPGDVELLSPINTDEGILVELVGLSPVAIAWEGLYTEENPPTGDAGVSLYIGLMVVAVLGMAGTVVLGNNKKKRKA